MYIGQGKWVGAVKGCLVWPSLTLSYHAIWFLQEWHLAILGAGLIIVEDLLKLTMCSSLGLMAVSQQVLHVCSSV